MEITLPAKLTFYVANEATEGSCRLAALLQIGLRELKVH